jgi:hypothetical protein
MKNIFRTFCLLTLFTSVVFTSFAQTSAADYFKGNWTVTITTGLKGTFSWTLKEDLGGSWLSGSVEQNGKRISQDFWRESGGKLAHRVFI